MSNTLTRSFFALVCVTGALSLPAVAADGSELAAKALTVKVAAGPDRVPATPGSGPDRVSATRGTAVRDFRDQNTPRASSRQQQSGVRIIHKTPQLGGHVFRNPNAKRVQAPKATTRSGNPVSVRINATGRR